MALNEIHRDGVSIPYPVEAAVKSGDLVVLPSGLVGVAETDAKENEAGNGYVATLRHDGVWAFPLAGAAVAGSLIYATVTPSSGVGVVGTVTTTAGTNPIIGTVTRAKGATAGLVYVNINRYGRSAS